MLRFIFSLLMFTCCNITLASNEVGNGTDHQNDSLGSAWFSQVRQEWQKPNKARVIRYCYELDSQFGLESRQVENALQTVFDTWAEYIKRKQVNDFNHVVVISKAEALKKCNGREDLKFYLGVKNEEVEELKKKYSNPTAFVHRRTFDVQQGWGQGFVWIAPMGAVHSEKNFPDWKEPGLLNAFLLHEVGHILGCGHIQGTIMDARLSSLVEKGKYPKSNWTRIDYSRQLVVRLREMHSYPGILGTPQNPYIAEEFFELLTGRKSQGKIWAEYGKDPWGDGLLVGDDLKTFRFAIVRTGIYQRLTLDKEKAFRYYIADPNRPSLKYRGGISSEAEIIGARLFRVEGGELEVAIELNAEQSLSEEFDVPVLGPINIRAHENGKIFSLFSSFPL